MDVASVWEFVSVTPERMILAGVVALLALGVVARVFRAAAWLGAATAASEESEDTPRPTGAVHVSPALLVGLAWVGVEALCLLGLFGGMVAATGIDDRDVNGRICTGVVFCGLIAITNIIAGAIVLHKRCSRE